MNEQLIVKNFGPIKDATVDFKRVTVFIGPTGGGKSTLAKLAAVLRNKEWLFEPLNISPAVDFRRKMKHFRLTTYLQKDGELLWQTEHDRIRYKKRFFKYSTSITQEGINLGHDLVSKESLKFPSGKLETSNTILAKATDEERKLIKQYYNWHTEIFYVPSERGFVATIDKGTSITRWKSLSLPPPVLDFIEKYIYCRYSVQARPFSVPFFDAIYRLGEKNYEVSSVTASLPLSENASGVQAVIPMMLIIRYNTEHDDFRYHPKSFIIEEPELNLYPTAQQGLLNWLVEKCTQGENDLTITTHSPYILSHLNLLLYAHHVGNKDEEKRRKVAAIIPEKYWVNPDEFAAYYVNGPEGAGGVRSLLDPETKLISQNELDAVSGIQADEFDQLLDINSGF